MQIHTTLLPILQKINFAERHRKVSLDYQRPVNRQETISAAEVKEILEKLGYSVTYNSVEKFFKLIEKVDDYQIQYNIALDGGVVELIYGIKKNAERLKIGSSVCTTISLITGENFTLKPVFRDTSELEEILAKTFVIYEDLKHELGNLKSNS